MKTLLITGAARGIGHELVLRAVARGDTVFAMVRKLADEGRVSGSVGDIEGDLSAAAAGLS